MTITGILPVRNGLALHYPFIEMALLALPYCTDLLLVDGGSDDGTADVLRRLVTLQPDRFQYRSHPIGPSTYWEQWDTLFLAALDAATGDWIYVIQADEYLRPEDREAMSTALLAADITGCNSIRQPRHEASWHQIDTYQYWTVRFFRRLPGINSYGGMDCFWLDGLPSVRPGYTMHNLPPESIIQIPLYNFSQPVANSVLRYYDQARMVDAARRDLWEAVRHTYGQPIHPTVDLALVPSLLHHWAGRTAYSVREELLDPACWTAQWSPVVDTI